MASRTDQLLSHQFMMQRVVGALTMRDPDPVSSPGRRLGAALLAGALVSALAIAAAAVYGVLRPGGDDSWRDGTAVIIEEETGARFVLRDGVLHPVVNYSSALLILSSGQPRRAYVPRDSLDGVPRGAALGILGAPDLLPAAADLVTSDWTLCSRPSTGPAGPVGDDDADVAESVLLVGSSPPVQPLGARAVVASDPAGSLYLIWNHRRYAIRDPDLVLAAFAWPRRAAMPLDVAVLNAVPAGPDLGRIAMKRSAERSAVAGLRIGEVFVVQTQSGARLYGVAVALGLAEITEAQADLLLADGANGPDGRPVTLGPAQFAGSPRVASLVPTGDAAPPATAPELVGTGSLGGVCATFADGGGPPKIGLAESIPRGAGEIRTTAAPADPAIRADWVAVRPGSGAVVEALAGPASPNGTVAVVSDLGRLHPLAPREVLGVLGYGDIRPQRLPAELVALVPTGAALDPVAARLPVGTLV